MQEEGHEDQVPQLELSICLCQVSHQLEELDVPPGLRLHIILCDINVLGGGSIFIIHDAGESGSQTQEEC